VNNGSTPWNDFRRRELCAWEDLFMRQIPKQQIKTAAASMGIGLAVFALIAYALMLLSVTQSLALRNPPDVIAPASKAISQTP
jgi:hypothetical protein